jgi:hypothetical protein
MSGRNRSARILRAKARRSVRYSSANGKQRKQQRKEERVGRRIPEREFIDSGLDEFEL